MCNNNLVKVDYLKTWFPVRKGFLSRSVRWLKAVDGVSFGIAAGKTLGLVGESGCGKTTLGRTILRLIPATSGEVFFDGCEVFTRSGRQMRNLRRDMQLIFQDPFGSLNPRRTVENIVGEALTVHGIARGKKRAVRVAELLEKVGMPASYAGRYPHEFSGGQRQRIGIARALALNPKFIVCDEPVSALDVSIQSQIINLLQDLQKEFGLTYLFIAHDLAVVEHMCDRIAVMYLGRLVELGADKAVSLNPLHPYTEALLAAVPKAAGGVRRRAGGRKLLKGDVPSPINPPPGCRFHTRCLKAMTACHKQDPPWFQVEQDHWVSCLLYA